MQDYIVKKDDILGRIAQQFNISLQDLLRINREAGNEIKDPDKIFVGQKIKIPQSAAPAGGGTDGGKKQKPAKNDSSGAGISDPITMTKEQYINHYLERATLSAMANGEYKSKIISTVENPEHKYERYIAPLEQALVKKDEILDPLEKYTAFEKMQEDLSKLIDGIDEAERYFTKNPSEHVEQFKLTKFVVPGGPERDFFGTDLEVMSMIEIGVAYGVKFLPASLPSAADGTDEGAAPGRNFMIAMLKKSEQIRTNLKLGGKPTPYYALFLRKGSKNYNPKFSQAWNKAAQKFAQPSGMQENKIIQEYILKNTPQPPKDVSVIEIIADEVNETLNNLPEIQLASEILSEDELKKLFSPFAKKVVMNVYGQIGEKIKTMVREDITKEELFDIINNLDGYEEGDQVTVNDLLTGMSDDDLSRLKTALESDDGTNASYITAIEAEIGRRVAAAAEGDTLPSPEDEGEVKTVSP